jgi:hypothetical protein
MKKTRGKGVDEGWGVWRRKVDGGKERKCRERHTTKETAILVLFYRLYSCIFQESVNPSKQISLLMTWTSNYYNTESTNSVCCNSVLFNKSEQLGVERRPN